MSLTEIRTSELSASGRRTTPKRSKPTSPRTPAKAKGTSATGKAAARAQRASGKQGDVNTRGKAKGQKGQSKPAVREGTKQALLIEMLRGPEGATIAELVKAIRWQAHSIRGAMSGALKKKLGLKVESKTVEGRGRIYRVAG
jgi:hypothetical protein